MHKILLHLLSMLVSHACACCRPRPADVCLRTAMCCIAPPWGHRLPLTMTSTHHPVSPATSVSSGAQGVVGAVVCVLPALRKQQPNPSVKLHRQQLRSWPLVPQLRSWPCPVPQPVAGLRFVSSELQDTWHYGASLWCPLSCPHECRGCQMVALHCHHAVMGDVAQPVCVLLHQQ
jgi:hypothetical protein